MNRRAFLCAIGFVAAPGAVEAEEGPTLSRIGILALVPRAESVCFPALREGLRDLGYTEGRNIVFEYRSPEDNRERLAVVAVQLLTISKEQPQDREGSRSHDPAVAAPAGGPGD